MSSQNSVVDELKGLTIKLLLKLAGALISSLGLFGVWLALLAGFFLLVVGTLTLIVLALTSSLQLKSLDLTSDFSVYKNIERKVLIINNRKYGLPIKQDLSKKERLALFLIRVGEIEDLEEDSLRGSEDSCGAYQQRVSEYYANSQISSKAREILKNDFDLVFTDKRKALINQYKNIQIRGINNKTVTFEYGVGHSWTGQHYGIDFSYFTGEEVYTALSGEVVDVTQDKLGGNTIVIKHDALYSLYAHLSTFKVKTGDKVQRGQVIAESGATGEAVKGPHLHFQLMKNIDKGWNENTINPHTMKELIEVQKSPFLGLCSHLMDIHLKTGLFDELALVRLRNRQELKQWLDSPDPGINIRALVEELCRSQAPASCVTWVDRVMRIAEKARQLLY
jgi:murein DD-endopeptidase MepM/ murein hydrolase activator NlpD